MTVPSPTGDVKSSALNSSISTFALNALIRKESGVFCEWPPGNPLVVWFW